MIGLLANQGRVSFRDRIKGLLVLDGDWPYIWLDAIYLKVRREGRVVSVAVVFAIGVNPDGRREVLGMAIGLSEAETFWVEFLRKLRRRGLKGVKLVVSDAHEGLKAAVTRVLGATPPEPAGPVPFGLKTRYGPLMVHFAVRSLMRDAALAADEDPDRLSFLHAVRPPCRPRRPPQDAGSSRHSPQGTAPPSVTRCFWSCSTSGSHPDQVAPTRAPSNAR